MKKITESEKRKGAKNAKPLEAECVASGSGDIFADLGVELSPIERLKVDLAYAISEIIRFRGLTQTQAAEMIGTTQGRVSNIARGKLTGITVEKLLDHLLKLGVDLDVQARTATITATKPQQGRIDFTPCVAAYG